MPVSIRVKSIEDIKWGAGAGYRIPGLHGGPGFDVLRWRWPVHGVVSTGDSEKIDVAW